MFTVYILSNTKKIQRRQISLCIFFSYLEPCLVYRKCPLNICWINDCTIHFLNKRHPVILCQFLDFQLQNEIPFLLMNILIASTSLWRFISHALPFLIGQTLFLTSAIFAHALEPLCYLAPQPGILSNSSLPTWFCYSDLGINDTSLAKSFLVAQSKIATLVPEITSSYFNYLSIRCWSLTYFFFFLVSVYFLSSCTSMQDCQAQVSSQSFSLLHPQWFEKCLTHSWCLINIYKIK